MDLGFETIGNATIICHDHKPVLVTDPWLIGSAYFGSWTLSHEIPEEQLRAATACDYVWLSHGHPDHLSGESLGLLKDKTILVPNHFGGRIQADLTAQGFRVQTIVDREWRQLSPRVRVMSLPDYNQDAVLLIDLDGTLLVNLNDAGDRGHGPLIRKLVKSSQRSFLLALSGYGDADMINFKTEDGQSIPPQAALKTPPGRTIARQAEWYGVNYFVPSSSMHKYQRADSLWAGQYTTRLEDYAKGFASKSVTLTPAFIQYDCAKDQLRQINPPERVIEPVDPKHFGDDWSETLSREDVGKLSSYFRRVKHLSGTIDFLNFKVGGRETRIEFNRWGTTRKGITFEVPRASLMSAVDWQIFDDLLIGNFMVTTLHGDFGEGRLYPDFSPYVAKYSDNAGVRSREDLQRYFAHYKGRDPLGFFRHQFETSCLRPFQTQSANVLRSLAGDDSKLFRLSKETYWSVRRAFL